jgi:hypothetical protein
MRLLRLRIALGIVALVHGLALVVFALVHGALAMQAAGPLAALILGIVTALLGRHLLFDALAARRTLAALRQRRGLTRREIARLVR